MDANLPALVCVALIVFVFVIPSWIWIQYSERRAKRARDLAVAAGRHQPVTIQPLIDVGACIGSGGCVKACPEDVLRVVEGQAVAVNMAACVGHGMCVAACPVDAIELVFGSDHRGIDIPEVKGTFETNVPGLYVAGELGGMGLIANAADQGVRALGYAAEGLQPGASAPDAASADRDRADIVIIGAGPAGLAAALEAKKRGLDFLLLEQADVGGAVLHYPRKKLVFTRPLELPLYGRVRVPSMRKEQLVDLFRDVVAKTGLAVSTHERVEAIDRVGETFAVTTAHRRIHAQRVLLCLGRRGTPRMLQVPGEQTDKVAYSLLEPEQFEYEHVLVVGGGDSAVEAACTLAEQPGNKVTLSYRGARINRPRTENVARLREAVGQGRIDLLLESKVEEIGEDRVVLTQQGTSVVLPNDYVFVFIGGVLPTDFLRRAGVQIRRHFGKRVEDVVEAPKAGDPSTQATEVLPATALAGDDEKTLRLPAPENDGADTLILPSSEKTEVLDVSAAAADEEPSTRLMRVELPSATDDEDEDKTKQLPVPDEDPKTDGVTTPRQPAPEGATPRQLDRLAFGPASGSSASQLPAETAEWTTQRDRAAESFERGDLDGAALLYKRVLDAGEERRRAEAIGEGHYGLARVRALRGELQPALALLGRASRALASTSSVRRRADVLTLQVALNTAVGDYTKALAQGERLRELVHRVDLDTQHAVCASWRAVTLGRLGFADEAVAAARLALQRPAAAASAERAARVLCDHGRVAEAEAALSRLPPPEDSPLGDDPIGQRMALEARILAAATPARGRAQAQRVLARPEGSAPVTVAQILYDTALALLAADDRPGARGALKAGLKTLRGRGAKGLKLELLLAFHRAAPAPQVAEAAARGARRILEQVPDRARAAFVARPEVAAVLRQWEGST